MTNVTPLHEDQVPAAAPHNTEIEAALLGALLTSDRAYDRVADILSPEHFYEPVHGRIYEAIGNQIESGKRADLRVIAAAFDNDEGLKEAGGKEYVYDLAASVITVANVKDYAEQIRDFFVRRSIMEICDSGKFLAAEAGLGQEAIPLAENLAESIDALMVRPNESHAEPVFAAGARALEMHEAAWKNAGEVTGISTGLIDLDRRTAGLHNGNLIILAGRPSMGKSALAWNIANSAARAGKRVLFFSPEMSGEELATREHAILSGIPSDRIRRGELSDEDFQALIRAQEELRDLPLLIDADSSLTVQAMRSRTRRAKRRHGVDLVVVDYLQLMHSSSHAMRYGNKVQEISEITRGLKMLAKEMNVPVLALSQLSRQVEQREDKRPMLSDLRESGSIEQDADVVLFVYRDAYYVEKTEPQKRANESDDMFNERFAEWSAHMSRIRNLAEIIVAKQRQGPVGKIKLYFDGPVMRFGNLETARQEKFDV